jgi:hypothetical protein
MGLHSYSWPRTSGRIVYLANEQEPQPLQFTIQETHPSLLYEYSVFGRRYIGGLIRFDGINRGTKRAAQRLAKRYKLGQQVDVYRSPRNPRMATLHRGIGFFLLIPLLFGGGGIVLSALVFMKTFMPAPQTKMVLLE